MFDDISLQEDDLETLDRKPVAVDPDEINHYVDIANFKLHRYLDRHNDKFKDFWKLDEIPEKNNFFYHHFPKVATNHDNEHHVSNFGIFMGHFYLGRWLPDTIQKLLFPLEPVERKLTAKTMPTIAECRLCERLKGHSVWTRTGEWFCVDDTAKLSRSDELGQAFFPTYNDFCKWRKTYGQRLEQMEKRAYDTQNVAAVEQELLRLEKMCYETKLDPASVLAVKRR
ncbi:hypothetical protein OGAPHI_005351 [Ogataea philodendri]|uniref:Uncharacterized protein n=1 Tax=Ogataea philodendri TaxID=1378263 RepID=A0A9P8T282_9ASCO|nr:uncharacterized protein OGAPHI_005351 [Ogataea philodendri]KAH3663361.1 hypothetical protein OGAPHI_005351 [Ogataea philodendri]